MSLTTRYLDFEILQHCFEYIFDKFMYYILNNIEDMKKIYFPTQKHICYSYTLRKIHQCSFFQNPIHSSELLGLIHLDFFELFILSYSKYKWVITFLNNYSFYYNIFFLHKKFETAEAIKLIFQMWSNTTFHSVKKLHTDNRREYVISELQFFLRK